MRDVGLELHPGKTRIVYCKDGKRNAPWDGPVSFDLLGYAFRPRDSMGKNGRFTGFDLAASPTAVKRMSETVTGAPPLPGSSSRTGSARSSEGGGPTTAGSGTPNMTGSTVVFVSARFPSKAETMRGTRPAR